MQVLTNRSSIKSGVWTTLLATYKFGGNTNVAYYLGGTPQYSHHMLPMLPFVILARGHIIIREAEDSAYVGPAEVEACKRYARKHSSRPVPPILVELAHSHLCHIFQPVGASRCYGGTAKHS